MIQRTFNKTKVIPKAKVLNGVGNLFIHLHAAYDLNIEALGNGLIQSQLKGNTYGEKVKNESIDKIVSLVFLLKVRRFLKMALLIRQDWRLVALFRHGHNMYN